MTTEIQKNLEDLFHIKDMPDDEKVIFLADLGNLILESAVLRFITESDESAGEHFSLMLEAYADKDDLHIILSDAFPLFKVILEEETEAFRKDALRILS